MGTRDNDFLYQVEPGDTLIRIAERYTLQTDNWSGLQRMNQVEDPFRLPIGMVIRIPLSMIPEQPATATVTHVVGQVTVDGRPLQLGEVLSAGQTLRSTDGGTATLQLEDQSLLMLPPDTTLEIQRLQTFQGTGLTDTQISIRQGTLESTVAPTGTGVGRFEVRTPATVTGVRGTRLRVHADASGSRLEVLQGGASIEGPSGGEQRVAPDMGASYDTRGQFLGKHSLLPPPMHLVLSRTNGQRLNFEPVPQAVSYIVRVALDPAGSRLESSHKAAGPGAPLGASSGGPRYVFVRGVDPFGIEGRDAVLAVDSLRTGLTVSDGSPVLTTDGAFVMLN
ncbi:MAG: FecR domain-containing protein [Castellaniella sp.]|uniref:FecR domain-containing protein n=1 Tax=Castellaniella sp. TaxID=1955812 RepID=UPI003A839A07